MLVTADECIKFPLRREDEKEKILPTLQFSKDKQPSYLAPLKRDEEPMCVKPSISFEKPAPRRKQAGSKTRWQQPKG